MKTVGAIIKGHRQETWWATASEKNHIDQMGTFTKATRDGRPHDQKTRRLNLLLAYRDTIPLRKDWGNIDKKEILDYVTRKIEKMEARNGGSETKETS